MLLKMMSTTMPAMIPMLFLNYASYYSGGNTKNEEGMDEGAYIGAMSVVILKMAPMMIFEPYWI